MPCKIVVVACIHYELDADGRRVLTLPDGLSYYVVFAGFAGESVTPAWPSGYATRVRFGRRITDAYRALHGHKSERELVAKLAF